MGGGGGGGGVLNQQCGEGWNFLVNVLQNPGVFAIPKQWVRHHSENFE